MNQIPLKYKMLEYSQKSGRANKTDEELRAEADAMMEHIRSFRRQERKDLTSEIEAVKKGCWYAK